MAAVNGVLEGMDTGKESVIISAIAEAVTWRHAMERATDPNFTRPGQRIIVYPKSLKASQNVCNEETTVQTYKEDTRSHMSES
jgi:hypothetical protein